VKVKVPILDFATDNAAMIALAACLKDKKPDKITAEANLRL
jgi:tRNA A37 threonylcarbamoyltransferase TsaD